MFRHMPTNTCVAPDCSCVMHVYYLPTACLPHAPRLTHASCTSNPCSCRSSTAHIYHIHCTYITHVYHTSITYVCLVSSDWHIETWCRCVRDGEKFETRLELQSKSEARTANNTIDIVTRNSARPSCQHTKAIFITGECSMERCYKMFDAEKQVTSLPLTLFLQTRYRCFPPPCCLCCGHLPPLATNCCRCQLLVA